MEVEDLVVVVVAVVVVVDRVMLGDIGSRSPDGCPWKGQTEITVVSQKAVCCQGGLGKSPSNTNNNNNIDESQERKRIKIG